MNLVASCDLSFRPCSLEVDVDSDGSSLSSSCLMPLITLAWCFVTFVSRSGGVAAAGGGARAGFVFVIVDVDAACAAAGRGSVILEPPAWGFARISTAILVFFALRFLNSESVASVARFVRRFDPKMTDPDRVRDASPLTWCGGKPSACRVERVRDAIGNRGEAWHCLSIVLAMRPADSARPISMIFLMLSCPQVVMLIDFVHKAIQQGPTCHANTQACGYCSL